MKKLCCLLLLLFLISGVSAFGAADTIYNARGQAVQVYAPNYFSTLTIYNTLVDLSNTLVFAIDSTVDCIVRLSATSAKAPVSNRVLADSYVNYGRGYGITYANISGCIGTYSAMKGDWTGQ